MALILIAEDNEINVRLFEILLKNTGYHTATAINGKEAIEMSEKLMPNLILMDIQMPVVDGISAMKEIKSKDQTKNIPIIAVTSFAMSGDKERLLSLGFDDYVSKPIDIKELLQKIKKFLED